MEKINKFYGLCISDERRKNLQKYEKLFGIEIDCSLSENAFEKSIEYYKNNGDIVKDWNKPLGAVGCAISFRNIFRDIVKNEYEYSIIFEDDINWNEGSYGKCSLGNFKSVLNKINFSDSNNNEKNNKNYWDILYLGTKIRSKIENQRRVDDKFYELESGYITIPIKEKTFESYLESVKSNPKINHRNFCGQHAFILTLNGAKQMLKYYNPIYTAADGLTSYAITNKDIKNLAFIPPVFKQLSHRRNGDTWDSQTTMSVL